MKIGITNRLDIIRMINDGIPNNTAIISFSDVEDEFVKFPKDTDVLQIAFYDVRPFTVAKSHYERIFPQAEMVAKYILLKIKEKKDIICQCDCGISRSAGCAAAILEFINHTGLSIFSDYRYNPNQFVFNKVYNELIKQNCHKKV